MRSTKSGLKALAANQQYLLGLNFVELIFKDRPASFFSGSTNNLMYLKFQLLG
jgi:hypothetical protein